MKLIKLSLILIFIAGNLYSQEIGAGLVKVWTDNYEIENPSGYSIYLAQRIGRLGLKLEYVSADNQRRYYGNINGGFLIAPQDFSQESILSESTYRSVEGSLQIPDLLSLSKNSLNIGGGIAFDKFTRVKTGQSTLKSYNTSQNKFGLFYSISISHRNLFGFPIKLELIFKQKFLFSSGYSTDTDQPFAASMDIKELQLNLAFRFI